MNPQMNVFGDQIFTLTIGKHHGQQKISARINDMPCNDSPKPAYFLRPPDRAKLGNMWNYAMKGGKSSILGQCSAVGLKTVY